MLKHSKLLTLTFLSYLMLLWGNAANALIECSSFFPKFHISSEDKDARIAFEKLMNKDTANYHGIYFRATNKILYDDEDVKQRIVDEIKEYQEKGEDKLNLWLQPFEAVTEPNLSKEGKLVAYKKKCIYKLYFGEDNPEKGLAKSIAKVEIQVSDNNNILARIGKNIADLFKEISEFFFQALHLVTPTTELIGAIQTGNYNKIRESLNTLSEVTEKVAKEGKDVLIEGGELVEDIKEGVKLAKESKE